jgi:glyoxalase family protein
VPGNGEVGATAYTIRPESVDFWLERLAPVDVKVDELQTRFGATVIPFHDPEGTSLELVTTTETATIRHWVAGPIPAEHAILGFYGATLWVAKAEGTRQLLTDQLGFTFVGQEGNRLRFTGAADDIGRYIDLLVRPELGAGRVGSGSVHHIAFRTRDDTEQLEYQAQLAQAGHGVTDVRDRQYFRSIYFRSPGGVLFEIATDAPGFAIDEPVDQLGFSLKLPPWLEEHRTDIQQHLPALNLQSIEMKIREEQSHV